MSELEDVPESFLEDTIKYVVVLKDNEDWYLVRKLHDSIEECKVPIGVEYHILKITQELVE